ncbi:MAG: putative 3-methyladenine DNA glycosylase [Eubacteriales bacterium SKADARSKE-1]|nr:putative 3-methyladenine DNA glycosylase [Eubacteriales bacterium SKADARSKE-1]
MRLEKKIYSLNALDLAPKLLGMILCRKIDGNIIKVRIAETEAYFGKFDTACHASKGKTDRNKIMYEAGGFTYIYLCYGMHNMLNIVSGKKNSPEAVLIQGCEFISSPANFKFFQNKSNLVLKDQSIEKNFKIKINQKLNGPGKLTKSLNIDRSLNGENLITSDKLWIEDDNYKCDYSLAKRVGIDYATDEYKNKLWRFIMK